MARDIFGNETEGEGARQTGLFDAEELRGAERTRRAPMADLAPEAAHYYQTGQLPPAYARAMVGLDGNFTAQALRAYNTRAWSVGAFATHCRDLYQKQQDADRPPAGGLF